MSGGESQFSTLGRRSNGNGSNGFGSQMVSAMSPRSIKNGSYNINSRNSPFDNGISSPDINGFAVSPIRQTVGAYIRNVGISFFTLPLQPLVDILNFRIHSQLYQTNLQDIIAERP